MIKGLNEDIQELKNKNQKLFSLNEENKQKIKELNEQLEEYKNKNNNINEENNVNINVNHGFKKLISFMNVGDKVENGENEVKRKSSDLKITLDNKRYQKFPTARFGGVADDNNNNQKSNEENNDKNIFMIEQNNE